MAKFTRRSYRRRKLFLGICLFASTALISTGFASWIISLNASGEMGGDVVIGTVTDSSVQIEINKYYEEVDSQQVEVTPRFVFGSLETDTSGRIRNDNNPENYEDMTLIVSGKITNTQFVSETTIELQVPDTLKAAAAAGYIILPTCVLDVDGEEKAALSLTESGTANVKNFTYQLDFKWGTKFGGMNPGVYYDNDPVGSAVSDADMIKELAQFRRLMLGLDASVSDKDALEATDDSMEFKVIIEAKVN